MSPRRYRLSRRAETAGETRHRLIEATFALHAEQGIRATSMKQIAERAGVSVGTAYHHFATYEDAVVACDRHATAAFPLPTAAMFEGAAQPAERVRRLAAECCRYFERMPWYEHIRSEPQPLPPIAAFVEREQANRVALMREALKRLKLEPQQLRSAAALVDIAVYAAMRRAGLSTAAAADEIAAFILARFVPPVRPRR
jgi:AcrR family transcriptional regulator